MKLAVLLLAACLSLAPAAWAVAWQRPVRGPVLRAFALSSSDPYARGQHRGVDLAAPPGAAVRAACGGRVRFAGSVPGGGRTVSVGCGRLVATYQHLATLAVRRGQVVVAGAAIGSVGRSGLPRAAPEHLHLGAREAASGRYVDPLMLLRGGPRAPVPLGRAPRGPVALGPAAGPASPRAAPVAVLSRPAPALSPPAPALSRPRGAPAAHVAPTVWIGLAAFGLGLPLGGLVRGHRRRKGGANAAARTRRWAAAHR